MECFVINGKRPLNGEIAVPSAKNSILPIMAGSILVDGVVKIHNYCDFEDSRSMIQILQSLGACIKLDGDTLTIDSSNIDKSTISADLALKLRASVYTMGALMYRCKYAKIAYPGGCLIGARPIDQHLKGVRALNGRVIERHGYLYCKGENLAPNNVYLDMPSVGATYNIILASVCLDGVTNIYNVAKEPEIVDFQNFLNKCGAKISGAGTDKITVKGVNGLLHSCEYTPIGDRIIAGTYLIATAITGGEVKVNNIRPKHLEAVLYKLQESGCTIKTTKDSITITSLGMLKSNNKVETLPFPGFPTDLQAPMMVLECVANGTSIVTENLFESRYKHVSQLCKLGADISVIDKNAIIKGVDTLYGADVYASDLRAGACLVLAGLVAEGYTTIYNIEHIDRGYKDIEKAFSSLGAKIERKKL